MTKKEFNFTHTFAAEYEIATIQYDFEGGEDAERVCSDADDIVCALGKLRKKAAELETLVNELYSKSRNKSHYEGRRFVIDEVLTEDTTIYEDVTTLVKALDVQQARYEKLYREAEAHMGQARSEAKWGTIDEQAMALYRGN